MRNIFIYNTKNLKNSTKKKQKEKRNLLSKLDFIPK